MIRNELKRFKKNWMKLEILEDKQLRKMSLRERLYQLASVVSMGIGLGLEVDEDREKLKVRSRWIVLKKADRNEGTTAI